MTAVAASPAPPTVRERRRPARLLRLVAIAAVTLTLIAPLVWGIWGARILVVDGGSMAPTYEVGDVLLVSAPRGDDLVVGDPVVIGHNENRYVHRVVEVDGDLAQLRGDANNTNDPGWVSQSDVSGVVSIHFSRPGAALIVAATSPEGRVALGLALVFLLLIPFFPRRVRTTHPHGGGPA
jgi:signal peptidase I